jgi:hypothetical protein
MERTSKDAMPSSLSTLFKTHLRGSRLVSEGSSVRLLRPCIALVHARGSTIMRGEAQPSPARDSIQTLVAMKERETCWLAAFQNTRVRPIGKRAAGTLLWLAGDWLWKFALRRNYRNPRQEHGHSRVGAPTHVDPSALHSTSR